MHYTGRMRTGELMATEEQVIFLNRERIEERQRHRERESGRAEEQIARETTTRGQRQRRNSLHQVSCSRTSSTEPNQNSEQEHQQSETPDDQLKYVFHHNEKMLGSLRERSMRERFRNAKRFTDAKGRVLGHILTIPSESRL